jgi:pyruvate kinase
VDAAPTGWPRIACTLPKVLDQVRVGERVWFDDGRIGGVIRAVGAQAVAVEITQARQGGETLRADKGINLPDSQLDLPALTEKDVQDPRAVAALADLVALSFVHEARDVQHLCEHLRRLGREDMGLVLKIETRRGFENLPALMLEAMRWPRAPSV